MNKRMKMKLLDYTLIGATTWARLVLVDCGTRHDVLVGAHHDLSEKPSRRHGKVVGIDPAR